MTTSTDAGARYRRAIGQTIANCRAERGWSLRACSDASGISLAYLSEIEHAQKEPSGTTLGQLGLAFDLSLPELLRRIADQIESQSPVPEELMDGLGNEEIEELSRFAQWLRWKKGQ